MDRKTTNMIQANELRIGNKLHFYKPEVLEKQVLTVNSIVYDIDITWVGSNVYVPINGNGISPIKLTTEILEACGFVKDNDPSMRNMDYWDEFFCPDLNMAGRTAHWNKHEKFLQIDYLYMHLKYLHQLQNLYFALTGEELDVKL